MIMKHSEPVRALILGSGGREHAIAKRLLQDTKSCHSILALPGNPGFALDGITTIPGDPNDFQAVDQAIQENGINLLIVGPEAPLVNGIRDYLLALPHNRNLSILGPSRDAARLEGSKAWAKQFMVKYGIPTARSITVTKANLQQGLLHIDSSEAPYVLKADGLAAGKGVLIMDDPQEAKQALTDMVQGLLGPAAQRVVIEQFLNGIELSLFVITDGNNYHILPEAKDYKRIFNGDQGPNTGGMGAVSPVPFLSTTLRKRIENEIVIPTIKGLQNEALQYRGFIFIGLMCSHTGDPYVIEYNVRLGDPETQVVLPRVKGNLLALMLSAAEGKLDSSSIENIPDPNTNVTITLASNGYPGSYHTGIPISIDQPAIDADPNAHIIHAGTATVEHNQLITKGGRVLSCCASATSLNEAIKRAYRAAQNIHFDGLYMRTDIGQDLLNYN